MTAPVKHVWIALGLVYVLWGSTYFGIKIAVETIPPLIAAGSRFAFAALILAAILALRGVSLRISRAQLLGAGIAGGLMLGFGVGLVHVAETRIDSSVAAMIAGTVPLQIIVLRLLASESPARATRLSTLAGLAGLLLVVAPGLGSGSTALGLAIMVSSTIAWSTGSFLSNKVTLPRDPFVATAWEMAIGGALLMIGAAAFGEYGDLGAKTITLDSTLAWAYLVVMGSLVGFSAYAWLLRVAPISLVVTHQYVNPLVAIALGVLFLGERPSAWTLAGAALIIAAVYVAIKSEFPRRSSPSETRRPAPAGSRPSRTESVVAGVLDRA
ncbi:MAG TPA: EamA family transporter [Gaiellaceae bacterium]|nr:EamA family transporter [Gaiellaceae bacterium]